MPPAPGVASGGFPPWLLLSRMNETGPLSAWKTQEEPDGPVKGLVANTHILVWVGGSKSPCGPFNSRPVLYEPREEPQVSLKATPSTPFKGAFAKAPNPCRIISTLNRPCLGSKSRSDNWSRKPAKFKAGRSRPEVDDETSWQALGRRANVKHRVSKSVGPSDAVPGYVGVDGGPYSTSGSGRILKH